MDNRQKQLEKIRNLLKLSFDNHDTEKSFIDGISREREYTQHVNKRESLMRDYEPFKTFSEMPLSQTKVVQSKFPELATNWGEQTVGFVSDLAAKARTLADEKLGVEKELNTSIARVRELQEQIESKQTKSVGELQKQVYELTEINKGLTTENERVQKEILSLNQKMEGLNAQIAGHEGELQTMTDMLGEKDAELDEATNKNEELGAQLETAKKDIAGQKTTNDSLLEELTKLKSSFEDISNKNATLLSDLEKKKTFESDNAVLNTQIEKMESTASEKEANNASIQAKMEERIREIKNQYKMENAKAKIVHDMEKDLMKHRHADAIEKQVEEITKNSSSSNAVLTAKISTMEQEHKNALEANKAALSDLENSHALVLSNANAENDNLKTQNEELEAANKACEEAKRALETKNKELQEANVLCHEKTAQLEAANAECENQRGKLQEANNAIKTELDENNARIAKIDEEIKKLNAETISLKQTNSVQAINHARKIEELKKEKLGIDQQNAKLDEALTHLQIEHETLKTKLKELKETYEFSTQELKNANAAELQTLIAKQATEIAKAEKKEKESITKFAIDACLINNSIESLKWTNWQNAKDFFIEKYGNVDITGLSDQIKSIGASTTLDELMKSFGLLKDVFNKSDSNNSSVELTSSQHTSVEPECMKNLTDLIIKFLQSQKEIEETKNEMAQKERETKKEKENNNSLLKALEELNDIVDTLKIKNEATKGENHDLSAEKEELQKQLNDLQRQMIEQNTNLVASQKKEMTELLYKNANANNTIEGLTEQLNKIKEELETKEESLQILIKNEGLRKIQFDELNGIIKAQETIVSELSDKVGAITNAKTQLSEHVKNDNLLQKLDDIKNENNKITAQLEELKKQNKQYIDNLVEAIKNEKQKSKLLQDQINANQKQINDLTSANEANQKQINNLTSANEANQEKIQTLSQEIETLTDKLRENETEIETLKSELDVKTQELVQINTQLQELKNNKSKIDKTLTDLQSANDEKQAAHIQELAKAKDEYEKALAAASETHKTDLQEQLAEAIEKLNNQLTTETAAKIDFEQKLQQLQNRELKLAKELLFLKLQLDLKEQQASNFKYTYTPPSTPTIVVKPRIKRDKITLLGGSNKSKIFMKGGAPDYLGYDNDTELVVVFDKTDYSTIGQYPAPATNDDYVVHCTEKEIKDYINRTEVLKAEIKSLQKELENLKNSASTSTTPICAFVNKMAHGASISPSISPSTSPSTSPSISTVTNAKLITKLILMQTHISSITNKFLLERIANMTNQQIVSTLNDASKKKIADLTTTIATNEKTIKDMEAKIVTNETTITDMQKDIDNLKITVSASSIGGGPSTGGPSGGPGPTASTAVPSGGIGVTNALAGYVKPNIAFVPGN